MSCDHRLSIDPGEEATLEAAPPESGVHVRISCVAGRYTLLHPIGIGGMATVWLANDRALGGRCAVKLLGATYAARPDACARFEQEARVLTELASLTEHVVHPIEHGVERGQPFIAMDLLSGQTLASLLARTGPLPAAQVAAVTAQIASAVTAAHRIGVVHRDLKLDNVFVCVRDGEYRVKVLDFGIAKRLGPSLAAQMTVAVGTLRYMSPEQMMGSPIDHRTDLWSLGVVAFQLLTGELPFDGQNIFEIARRTCEAQPPSAVQLVPALSPEVDAFFSRAFARDPARRFQSAEELVNAFARAAGVPPRAPLPQAELTSWAP